MNENVLNNKERFMSDDKNICFECMGDPVWCPACKKKLPVLENEERVKSVGNEEEIDPNQLPLL